MITWKKKSKAVPDKHKIVGVCMGWDLKPHLSFEDGTYLPTTAERILYPQYFKNGDWPTDPITQVKLSIESYRT